VNFNTTDSGVEEKALMAIQLLTEELEGLGWGHSDPQAT